MPSDRTAATLHHLTAHTSQLHAPASRGAGERAASSLSATAQKLELYTAEDVEREFVAAHQGWSGGGAPPSDSWWFCPFCDRTFGSISGARKHMKGAKHRVLRGDWYDELAGMGPR